MKLNKREIIYTTTRDGDGTPRLRIATGIPGIDRVLGGGFVPNSTVLLSGPKGVGMTTFALQIETALHRLGADVLHVSATQTPEQLVALGKRIGADPSMRCLYTRSLSDVIGEVKRAEVDPDVVVIDNLDVMGGGDMRRIIEIAHTLVEVGKRDGRLMIFATQEPAEGEWAGSQQVHHLVDVCLRLSAVGQTRRLTDPKNRYGWADVSADFDMTPTGLVEIAA